MRFVVKFGGSSIADLDLVHEAAEGVAQLVRAGHEVMVVVSAMGRCTDQLMKMGRGAWLQAPFNQDFLQLLATGEMQSASVMSMALSSLGLKTAVLGFGHPGWPLVAVDGQADNQSLSECKVNDPMDVTLDEVETSSRFAGHVEPMLAAGIVPVFPGFFIREHDRNLVTLGRGGSDVTAFLVGRFGRADEVVVVTDVEGVLTADPRVVEGSEVVPVMDAGLLSAIARNGAQVLHPNALKHKPEGVGARVVHHSDLGRLTTALVGTVIEGGAGTELSMWPNPLTLVLLFTSALASKVGILEKVGAFIASRDVPIHSMTQSDEIAGLYLDAAAADDILDDLHGRFVGVGKEFTELMTVGPVAEITMSNAAFVNTPGVISGVSNSLGNAGINIVEMVTSHTRIVAYCRFEDGSRAAGILADRLGCSKGGG